MLCYHFRGRKLIGFLALQSVFSPNMKGLAWIHKITSWTTSLSNSFPSANLCQDLYLVWKKRNILLYTFFVPNNKHLLRRDEVWKKFLELRIDQWTSRLVRLDIRTPKKLFNIVKTRICVNKDSLFQTWTNTNFVSLLNWFYVYDDHDIEMIGCIRNLVEKSHSKSGKSIPQYRTHQIRTPPNFLISDVTSLKCRFYSAQIKL